jgi:hypothetical protein
MQFAQVCDRVETHPSGEIDRKGLIGTWINSNLDTNSIARVKITDANGKLQLQVLAMGPDGLIDWGTVEAPRSLPLDQRHTRAPGSRRFSILASRRHGSRR